MEQEEQGHWTLERGLDQGIGALIVPSFTDGSLVAVSVGCEQDTGSVSHGVAWLGHQNLPLYHIVLYGIALHEAACPQVVWFTRLGKGVGVITSLSFRTRL